MVDRCPDCGSKKYNCYKGDEEKIALFRCGSILGAKGALIRKTIKCYRGEINQLRHTLNKAINSKNKKLKTVLRFVKKEIVACEKVTTIQGVSCPEIQGHLEAYKKVEELLEKALAKKEGIEP